MVINEEEKYCVMCLRKAAAWPPAPHPWNQENSPAVAAGPSGYFNRLSLPPSEPPAHARLARRSAPSPAELSRSHQWRRRCSGGGSVSVAAAAPEADGEPIALLPHRVAVSVPDGPYYTPQILQEAARPRKRCHFHAQPLERVCVNCGESHYANFKTQ